MHDENNGRVTANTREIDRGVHVWTGTLDHTRNSKPERPDQAPLRTTTMVRGGNTRGGSVRFAKHSR